MLVAAMILAVAMPSSASAGRVRRCHLEQYYRDQGISKLRVRNIGCERARRVLFRYWELFQPEGTCFYGTPCTVRRFRCNARFPAGNAGSAPALCRRGSRRIRFRVPSGG